jgi:hypothetical protein
LWSNCWVWVGGGGGEQKFFIIWHSHQRVLSSFTFMDRIFLPVKQLYINNKLLSAEM